MAGKGYGWTTSGLKQPPYPRGGWCPTCGEPFASDTAFDAHRVGRGEHRTCTPVADFAERNLRWLPSEVWALTSKRSRPAHWGTHAAED